jgi:hypothetical protein
MAGCLYFVPCEAANREAVLARCPALAYALPDGEAVALRGCVAGPGGQSGTLAAVASRPPRLDLTAQRWEKMAGAAGDPWLGLEAAARPGPDDLRRRRPCVETHPVVLGDGRAWDVPVVRLATGDCALPAVLRLDAGGAVRKELAPEHQRLFDMAEAVVLTEVGRAVGDPQTPAADPALLMALAEAALGLHYRVARWEIAALGLLTTANARDIADAVCDGPNLKRLVEEWQSKKNGACAPGPE